MSSQNSHFFSATLFALSALAFANANLARAEGAKTEDIASSFHNASCVAYEMDLGSSSSFGSMIYATDGAGTRLVYNSIEYPSQSAASADAKEETDYLSQKGICATIEVQHCAYAISHLYCEASSANSADPSANDEP